MGKGPGWAVLGAIIAFAVLIGISLVTWKQRDTAISQAATAEAASTTVAAEASTAKANAEEAQQQTIIARAGELAALSEFEFIRTTNFPASLLLGVESYRSWILFKRVALFWIMPNLIRSSFNTLLVILIQ